MAKPNRRRDLICAAVSACLGIWAFVQTQLETKEMFEPILAACGDASNSTAAAEAKLVPFEPRLGGTFVCLITQFLHDLTQSSPAGFIAWAATMTVAVPLGLLMSIEGGRSGAKGPVLYPTIIGLLAQFLGISVSFPVIWVPGFLLFGGSRTGAVPALRCYAAVYLLPPAIVLTYLAFNLDVTSYNWTLTAGIIGGPVLPLFNLLLWRLKPKPVDDVTPKDVSRGAQASANCFLIASVIGFGMWLTVLREILGEYGLSLEAFWGGVWTNASGSVRFMVIDTLVLFAGGLCYVASVDPVDAVAATLVSPIIGPGASVGLMLWGHEKLRMGRANAELMVAEKKTK